MFDVGFWEFAIIGVIVLIVVGPEKMPQIAKKAGRIIAKIKHFIAKTKADINDELDTNTIKQHLKLEDENANIVEILQDSKDTVADVIKK